MFSFTGMCALVSVSVLFFILGYLIWNGGKSLNPAFFTQLPKPPGEAGGGMANALVGSAEIVLIATLIGLPVGFLGGVHLAEFGGTMFPFLVRYTADLLNGVPSIVLGMFTYSLIVVPMHHFSALAGGVGICLALEGVARPASAPAAAPARGAGAAPPATSARSRGPAPR